jgi:hypothetical protein
MHKTKWFYASMAGIAKVSVLQNLTPLSPVGIVSSVHCAGVADWSPLSVIAHFPDLHSSGSSVLWLGFL